MSYSSLIQTVPEVWRSSSGLAVLASLGIHGLLVALLPYVSLDTPQEQLQRTVGVVTLTPEEQSRLPQVLPEATQATIPSTATGQTELPPLPSAGNFQSDSLPLPPTPSFLPPPPPINTPTYQYPISNSLPPSPIPAPIPLPPPPQSGSSISQYPLDRLPEPQLPEPQPNQNIKNQQSAPLPPNPALKSNLPSTTGLKPGEPLKLPDTKQTENQVAVNNRNNGPTQRLTPSRLPERAKQELIARRNAIIRERNSQRSLNQDSQRLAAALQRRQQNSTTPNNSSQRLAAALQRRQQQPNTATQPQLSRATTQTIAQIDAFKQQQERTLQTFPTAVIKPPIRSTIKTCNKQLDGSVAILAAVIGTDGKVISGPDLLSKNSSAGVQRTAKRFVKEYAFPKTDNPVNQSFRLNFTYDSKSCSVKK